MHAWDRGAQRGAARRSAAKPGGARGAAWGLGYELPPLGIRGNDSSQSFFIVLHGVCDLSSQISDGSVI